MKTSKPFFPLLRAFAIQIVGIVSLSVISDACLAKNVQSIHTLKINPKSEKVILNLPLSKAYIYAYKPHTSASKGERYNEAGALESFYGTNQVGWKINPEAVSRQAIGALAYHLNNSDPEALEIFFNQVNYLQNNLKSHKTGLYGWAYNFDYEAGQHYSLKAPWLSGMAQAQGIATLARAWHLTGDEEYLHLIKRALKTLLTPVSKGGLLLELDNDAIWIEEYPTKEPSFVLNGFLFATYALYEVMVLCPPIADEFELKSVLKKLRNGLLLKLDAYSIEEGGSIWSAYDLFVNKPEVHIKLYPTAALKKGTDKAEDIQILMHQAKLTTPSGQQVIKVGHASDASKKICHVNDSDLYSLGERELADGWHYRRLFAKEGRYPNSVFTFYLDPHVTYSSDLELTLNYRQKARSVNKDDNLVLVQLYESSKNETLGYIKAKNSGEDQSVSFKLPLDKVLMIANSKKTSRNVQKFYHFLHVFLLPSWVDIWPEDYDLIHKTLKSWLSVFPSNPEVFKGRLALVHWYVNPKLVPEIIGNLPEMPKDIDSDYKNVDWKLFEIK